MEYKKCNNCKQEYPHTAEYFAKSAKRLNGLTTKCIECNRQAFLSWYARNRDKRLQTCKDNKQWYKNETQKRLQKKYLENPTNKIHNRCFVMINAALTGKLKKNSKGWIKRFDFTIEELKTHLEVQFTDGMNWGNRASLWEIDHIIPTRLFNFTSEDEIAFKECWGLKNLRPLTKQDNLERAERSKKYLSYA